MTRIARGFLVVVFALLAATPAAVAQAHRTYSQAELDQMLAPVALYPDVLLSQILMAATYQTEVVEAARWTRDYPSLQGDDAVRAVQNKDWDPSVKSLVAFPQILQRMDEQIDWTRSLGDAFLAHEPQMMDTVQQLRRRAEAAGNLQSSEQILVEQQDQSIVVQPASPQVVYVPYYDPLVVYGAWWWPAYQPVRWAPWPGYAHLYRSGTSANFRWGRPVRLPANFFFGNFDWRERHVRVVNRTAVTERGGWQQDQNRRRGVDFRSAEVRQRVERRPAQVQAQPQLQPQAFPRPDRRLEREPARIERRATLQAQPQPRALPEVRPQPQARRQPEARPQPQVRQEQRPRMPEARAPQQPSAAREERREMRQQLRNERGHKGSERS